MPCCASIWPSWACRDARFVRSLKMNGDINAWRLERPHEPCVPTYIQMIRCIIRIDNQSLTPCFSISAILPYNLTHFTVQSQPYCAVKWLRLKSKVRVPTHISVDSWQVNGFARCLFVRILRRLCPNMARLPVVSASPRSGYNKTVCVVNKNDMRH